MSAKDQAPLKGPGPLAMVKLALPRIPVVGIAALYHLLGISRTSKYWSLTTELIITIIRSFISDDGQYSISFVQRLTTQDAEVKGRMWVSRTAMEASPEESAKEALFAAIDALKHSDTAKLDEIANTELTTITGEWNAYRGGVDKNAPEPKISEKEKYEALMKEVESPTTILYFHGGAHYLLDPVTHRKYTVRLAKLTKGRVYSVRYRLAPKHPFPAAILDALVSYLNLLYPPPGSYHEPVKPEHIVFAGDSAGGNISFSLLQAILEIRRQGRKITWFGEERELPVPAGVAGNSPWLDITSSSPSCEANAVYDYLCPDSLRPEGNKVPACAIWPASPARANIYVVDEFMQHPLVSVFAAKNWEGSCPVYIETGEELLTDEDKYLASVMAKQGVPVVFEQYEAMPHCFAMVLKNLPACVRLFESWASFIKMCVEEPEKIQTKGTLIRAKTLKEENVDVATVSKLTEADVEKNMQRRVEAVNKFMMEQPAAAKKQFGSKL